jgi:hypothetical protein
MVKTSSIDEYKKGRMVALAVVIGLLILVLKLLQAEQTASLPYIYLRAFIAAVVTYVGLLWVFQFQVAGRTLMYVLTQASLLVFNQTLFVELFIFRRVGRIYEALLLLTVLGIITGLSYVSFATANVFNVAHFKKIPLVAVGKTMSFLLTLISIYFVSYSIFESGFFPLFTILILGILYFLLIIFHLRHLEIPRNVLWRVVFLTLGIMIISVVLLIITGLSSAVMAFTPVVLFYCLIGLQTNEKVTATQLIEYFLLTIIVFAINFIGR